MKQDLVENLLTKASLKQLRILVAKKYLLDQSEITFEATLKAPYGSNEPIAFQIRCLRAVNPHYLKGKAHIYRLMFADASMGDIPLAETTEEYLTPSPSPLMRLYREVRKQAYYMDQRPKFLSEEGKAKQGIAKTLLQKAAQRASCSS